MAMTWDEEIDFLIVGSGAAGLSAAMVAAEHKARIKVIEKSAYIGGTSATSGGGVWIPCSPLAAAMGEQDSPQKAFDYMRALVGDGISNERIEAFVSAAPAMLNWMAEPTELRFNSVPYPDYHPEAPGAKIGWRTHFPEAFDGRRLGKTV
ncbi:MAG: 3-oxosteroid 1-dehydrogenase, partial [Bermanella sp.]